MWTHWVRTSFLGMKTEPFLARVLSISHSPSGLKFPIFPKGLPVSKIPWIVSVKHLPSGTFGILWAPAARAEGRESEP